MSGGLRSVKKRLDASVDHVESMAKFSEEVVKGVTGYGAYSEAKKARKQAEEDARKQAALQAEQDKLVAEQQAKEDAEATERKARLSKGRRGLLFGSETGVSTKLGG